MDAYCWSVFWYYTKLICLYKENITSIIICKVIIIFSDWVVVYVEREVTPSHNTSEEVMEPYTTWLFLFFI